MDITSQTQLRELTHGQLVYVTVNGPNGPVRLQIRGRSISDMLRRAKESTFTKLTAYVPEEGFVYLSLATDHDAIAKQSKRPRTAAGRKSPD